MPWALSDIRRKTRQVSGRLSSNELTTQKLDEYINDYYQFTFPAETKLDRDHTYYEFNTEPNVQDYTYPSDYTNFEPPVYVNNMPLLFYQDPTVFFQENPINVSMLTPWVGDALLNSFSTTVQYPPIIPGSVIVTDNNEIFSDDSLGVLVGDLGGTGTINYLTGSITVNFNTAPADGQNIYLSFEAYAPARPTSVLLYDNHFRFFPIPDTVYRVRVKAYSVPLPLVNATDKPKLEEWGEAISYGAARMIASDFGEMDRYAEITQLYQQQIAYILTRTNQQLLNERARPMW